MDKIIKGKLVLPAYLTVDARELIRNVSYDRIYLLMSFQKHSGNEKLTLINFSYFVDKLVIDLVVVQKMLKPLK